MDYIDLNELTPEEVVELGAYLAEDLEKDASEELDLNELSVEEFIEFAAAVSEELEKSAGATTALTTVPKSATQKIKDFAFKYSGGAYRDRAKMLGEAMKKYSPSNPVHKTLAKKRMKALAYGYGIPAAEAAGGGLAAYGGYKLVKK